MKKIFLVLIFLVSFACVSQSQVTNVLFTTGDTTEIVSVNDASAVLFTIRDSSMSGSDSIYVGLRMSYNGISFYSTVTVHLLETTTTTTFISSALLVPGDNTTKTYVWYAGNNGSEARYTGDFWIARLNQPPTAAGYQPKTRIIVTPLY